MHFIKELTTSKSDKTVTFELCLDGQKYHKTDVDYGYLDFATYLTYHNTFFFKITFYM